MALFIDGPSVTIDDLTGEDSGLLEVAQTCGINVSTKLSLAHEDIGSDLQLWIARPRPTLEIVWGATTRIQQVVVTPELKRWEGMQALSFVYRDAYFSQLADRYQAKWDEYSALTKAAYERFVASGMGLVSDPVARAGLPVLGSIAAPQNGGTFYASVAWVNAARQEGAPSPAASIALNDGNVMTVSAAGAPVNAAGFNVYAGSNLSTLSMQNSSLLPVGGAFTYIPGSALQGSPLGNGQQPDFVRPLRRTLLRG